MTTYSTPGYYSPVVLSSAGYTASPPPVTVMQVAPSSEAGLSQVGRPFTGAPAQAVQSGIPVQGAPAAAPSHQRSATPNVRIQYNEKREDLPSTSLRNPRDAVIQAAHQHAAAGIPADEVVMNQPSTGPDILT